MTVLTSNVKLIGIELNISISLNFMKFSKFSVHSTRKLSKSELDSVQTSHLKQAHQQSSRKKVSKISISKLRSKITNIFVFQEQFFLHKSNGVQSRSEK